MDSAKFYSNLTSFSDFTEVTNQEKFRTLPNDWLIVVADISNSTDAVSAGELKAVNIIGVSVITAIRNVVAPIEIPYMFGGDGACLCIPQQFKEQTQQALIATRQLAQHQFRLNLRVGMLSMTEIQAAGFDVQVAKHSLSEFYDQAAFSGGGMEYAESQLKINHDELLGIDIGVSSSGADYEGLECRWDQVLSKHGETIALIVKATGESLSQTMETYELVIRKVASIYGQDEICRPVHSRGLQLTYNKQKLSYETRVRTAGLSFEKQRKYFSQIFRKNIIGGLLMALRLKIGGIAWGNYKSVLVINTDFKKFDGTLRQVLSGNAVQRQQLVEFLQGLYQQGKCVFGIHVSDAALITCMIDNRAGEHYHFVDSAGGGYTSAAEAMKQQLQS